MLSECLGCGKLFRKTKEQQRYCSRKCSKENWYRQNSKILKAKQIASYRKKKGIRTICEKCGGEFFLKINEIICETCEKKVENKVLPRGSNEIGLY